LKQSPPVLDETFRVNSAFNAKPFLAPPDPVAMEFDLFGERRSGHWVNGAKLAKLIGFTAGKNRYGRLMCLVYHPDLSGVKNQITRS
jgi:hypothetical protein